MPRPRIYEEIDRELKLEELVKMACDLFGPSYDDREDDMLSRRSIREVGRIMHLSEAKVKSVSNLSIFEHFCHPIFDHRSIKKAAEAAVFNI